jgi:hypothetical protein
MMFLVSKLAPSSYDEYVLCGYIIIIIIIIITHFFLGLKTP